MLIKPIRNPPWAKACSALEIRQREKTIDKIESAPPTKRRTLASIAFQKVIYSSPFLFSSGFCSGVGTILWIIRP